MSRAIGIDLGSSSSCVSIWRNGQAEPVINDWGNTVTPSYVSFTDKGRLFGDAAKYRASIHPSNTIYNFKSLLGRKFSDSKVQSLISQLPYQVVDRGGIPSIRVDYRGERKEYIPQEIVAMLLLRLKELAELEQGTEVSQAVIAVPSFFTFVQREAVRDAAQIAGLHTLKIVNEATAAAVHHLISNGVLGQGQKNIIVLDFGAASLDTSVIVMDERALEVKATTSNPKLGGTHFDDVLVAHFASMFKSLHQKDIYGYPRALQRLRHACERAKTRLSFASQIPLEVDTLVEGDGLYSIMTQTRFEDLCGKLFEQVAPSVERALSGANLNPRQIHEVVITGGSSRIPAIKSLVKRIFDGKTPSIVDPDCSVANGAATLAAILTSPANVESRRFNEYARLDIAPHGLGVATSGGLMTTIVPRFAQIPIESFVDFTTVQDFQPSIVIRLYEGEHSQAKDNLFLGRLVLLLGHPQPRGFPRIRIAFTVDSAQIVVTANLIGTEESTTLTSTGGG
ncbi:hypothetical protein NLI96_g10451 [Meripilus lineatus]|uniref:non-chaperonin molecular chaperone ATPase n=1 Tax=Meripilus lineatus TaxID=2056292 RepID=A0AAD5UW05_9APHY|nr:hypothetical protein NLI96_g10451 [Physisporinus lineatus]